MKKKLVIAVSLSVVSLMFGCGKKEEGAREQAEAYYQQELGASDEEAEEIAEIAAEFTEELEEEENTVEVEDKKKNELICESLCDLLNATWVDEDCFLLTEDEFVEKYGTPETKDHLRGLVYPLNEEGDLFDVAWICSWKDNLVLSVTFASNDMSYSVVNDYLITTLDSTPKVSVECVEWLKSDDYTAQKERESLVYYDEWADKLGGDGFLKNANVDNETFTVVWLTEEGDYSDANDEHYVRLRADTKTGEVSDVSVVTANDFYY